MKKILKKSAVLCASLLVSVTSFAQVKIASNNNVGIGNSNPAHKLDVLGSGVRFAKWLAGWEEVYLNWDNQWGAPQLYCKSQNFMVGTRTYPIAGVYTDVVYANLVTTLSSDERLKENIKPLETSLDKLLQIEGKRYNYKKATNSFEKNIADFDKIREKTTFGFLAQDLEKIFPELVYAPDSINSSYSINYVGMIPVLVEAIKEQQNQIDNLQKMLSECSFSKNTSTLKSYIIDNEEEIINKTQQSKLYNNIPNPFSEKTEIRFEIPDNATSAQLMICNLNGVELKSYNLTQKGLGSIIIQGSEFAAGIYLYTLLVNNQIVDTKKMVLTK